MNIYYADTVPLPLPYGHRFPSQKYTLLRERVAQEQLESIRLLPSSPASDEDLLLIHQEDYLHRLQTGQMTEREMRRTGFPWSPELVERSRRSVGATLGACRAALQEGVAANLGGGTHHAFPDHGEGFCVFNDVAVAARRMQRDRLAQRIVVIDCDAHQGNGTAAIFAGDESVETFDLYAAKNFPFHKEQPDLGLPMPDGSEDALYLETLEEGLWRCLSLSRPDMAIYLAGADPYAGDRLGRLALSKQGLRQRDEMVLSACRERSLPVAIVMAGGYGRDIHDTVDIQAATIRTAEGLF